MAGTDWYKTARCAGRDDLDWFDLDCGLQQTLTICHSCNVQDECLAVAVRYRYYEGVWGGLYGKQLAAMVNEHRGGHAEPY